MEAERYPEIALYKSGLSELGIELSERQLQQFMDYYELLIEKNKVMNLTSITERKEVISKHFIDSLSIVKIINLSNEKIIDLGTGAGFPGIPLKIAFPELRMTLFDSLRKRLNFLEEVISKLELKDIVTLHGRAEDFGNDLSCREQFDICVSRAVAKLPVLMEYCIPYVKKGGYFIAYKSGKIEDEIHSSQNALTVLKSKIKKIDEFKLPDTDMERTLILFEKLEKTPKNYPRNAGKPEKNPL